MSNNLGTTMELPIIIYKARKKSAALIVLGVLAAVAGILFLNNSHEKGLGWIIIIFSVLLMILGLGTLLDRKPQIIITERGITDMYSIKEEIEWSAILYADDFFYRGQYFVRLLLPRTYKPQSVRPTWFWRLDRIYRQDSMKAIYIKVSGLDVNSMQLIDIIEKMVISHSARISGNGNRNV